MSKVSEIDIYQKQLKIKDYKLILCESQLISLSNETKFSLLGLFTGYEFWESSIL